MTVIDKNNKISNLYFVLRVLGTVLLFECIYIMGLYLSALIDSRNADLLKKWGVDGTKTLSFLTNIIIIAFVIYSIFMIVNYMLYKSKSKNANKIFIGEMLIVVIVMIFAFVELVI